MFCLIVKVSLWKIPSVLRSRLSLPYPGFLQLSIWPTLLIFLSSLKKFSEPDAVLIALGGCAGGFSFSFLRQSQIAQSDLETESQIA